MTNLNLLEFVIKAVAFEITVCLIFSIEVTIYALLFSKLYRTSVFNLIKNEWHSFIKFLKGGFRFSKTGAMLIILYFVLFSFLVITNKDLIGNQIILSPIFIIALAYHVKDDVVQIFFVALALSITVACVANMMIFGNLSPENMCLDMLIQWIGYLGATVGGALTLTGVFWTINHEKKQRKESDEKHERERLENLSIEYKPILKLSIIDSSLRIENLGRGEAVSVSILNLSKVQHLSFRKFYSLQLYKNDIICKDEIIDIDLSNPYFYDYHDLKNNKTSFFQISLK